VESAADDGASAAPSGTPRTPTGETARAWDITGNDARC
jgi:hypothetical protein